MSGDLYEVMNEMEAVVEALDATDYKRNARDTNTVSRGFQHAYRVPDVAEMGDGARHLEFIIQPLRTRVRDRGRTGDTTRLTHEVEIAFQYELSPGDEVAAMRLSYRAAMDINRAVCNEGKYPADVEIHPDIAYEFSPSGEDKFVAVRIVFTIETTESL